MGSFRHQIVGGLATLHWVDAHLQPQLSDAFAPIVPGNLEWIDFEALPPRCFVTNLMQLSMMAAAERHGEIIADLHANGAGLRKA